MKWLEPQEVEVPAELQAAVGGHSLVAQALVRRGLVTPQAARAFLDPACYVPASPFDLPDMDKAVNRLQGALARGEGILVWGDFDVDGLTSTALLVEALRELGGRVEWYVPDRQTESHGLHWRSLQPFLGRGIRVLLTCDTGTSEHETIALARNMGLDVVVTDHHDLPARLPKAQAIVNPNRLDESHPLHNLAGVGVAYKLAEALGVPDRGLDLMALGLVADVVPLRGDVRYLVQRGLQALRQTKRPGLQALLEVAEKDPGTLTETDISFSLAPRLNALGRLAQASVGVELFLSQDLAHARAIAHKTEALNVRRQFLSRQVTRAAQEQVLRNGSLLSSPVLVLTHPEWPGSVLGIAASRLTERYHRPVVLIATPPGEAARGSARSVPGVDIRSALAEHCDLLDGYGGHPMAAGFSISADRVPDLRRGLVRTVAGLVGEAPPEPELRIEAYCSLAELNLELCEELSRLAPFGAGNPAPILATRGLRVAAQRTIGRTGEHRRLKIEDEAGDTAEVLWWHSEDLRVPEGTFDLAYVLDINEFRGQRRLQPEWVDARWAERPAIELTEPAAELEVADYRGVLDPLAALRALWSEEMQLWAEAVAVPGFTPRERHELQPAGDLIVWTTPPGPQVMADAMERAEPSRAYLFATDAGLDALVPFLQRLLGLVKHGLGAHEGLLDWQSLAAAMAHRVRTVQAGVRWLVARGSVTVIEKRGAAVIITEGGVKDEDDENVARCELEELLRETTAYRAYFRRADARRLVGG